MPEKNEESKVRKILFNEVSLFIGLIAVVLSSFIYLTNPQIKLEAQIQEIKLSIEGHQQIQAAIEKLRNNDLVEIKEGQKRLEDRQLEIIKSIVELQTLIKNK
jgi:hypothetical protein